MIPIAHALCLTGTKFINRVGVYFILLILPYQVLRDSKISFVLAFFPSYLTGFSPDRVTLQIVCSQSTHSNSLYISWGVALRERWKSAFISALRAGRWLLICVWGLRGECWQWSMLVIIMQVQHLPLSFSRRWVTWRKNPKYLLSQISSKYRLRDCKLIRQ